MIGYFRQGVMSAPQRLDIGKTTKNPALKILTLISNVRKILRDKLNTLCLCSSISPKTDVKKTPKHL